MLEDESEASRLRHTLPYSDCQDGLSGLVKVAPFT